VFFLGDLGFTRSLLFRGPIAPFFFVSGGEGRSFQGSSASRIMFLVARVAEGACMVQAFQYIDFSFL